MSTRRAPSSLFTTGRPRVAGAVSQAWLLAQVSDPARDLHGSGDCVELLNITRAKTVTETHARLTRAGAEFLFTNTAGAAPQLLDRYRMHDEAFAVSYLGAEIAMGAARRSKPDGARPLVIADVRMPGHLPKLGFVTCDEAEAGVRAMVSAHVTGNVDAVCLQTSARLDHLAATVNGARAGMAEAGRTTPLLLSVRQDASSGVAARGSRAGDPVAAGVLAHAMGASAVSIDTRGDGESTVALLRKLAEAIDGPLFVAPGIAEAAVRRCLSDPQVGPRLAFVGAESPAESWRLSRFTPARTGVAGSTPSNTNDNMRIDRTHPVMGSRR